MKEETQTHRSQSLLEPLYQHLCEPVNDVIAAARASVPSYPHYLIDWTRTPPTCSCRDHCRRGGQRDPCKHVKARHLQLRWGQDARNSAGESIKLNFAKVNIRKLNTPAAALAAAPADSPSFSADVPSLARRHLSTSSPPVAYHASTRRFSSSVGKRILRVFVPPSLQSCSVHRDHVDLCHWHGISTRH